MSKRTEERLLEAEKNRNTLDEKVKKVEAGKLDLEKENGVVIYAQIEQIGAPTIKIVEPKPRNRKLFESKASFKKATKEKLQGISTVFTNICKINGVAPVAKITEFGAQVFYKLEQKKEAINENRKEN